MKAMKHMRTTVSILLSCLAFLATLGAYGFFFIEIKGKNERISAASNEILIETRDADESRALKRMIQTTIAERDRLDAVFVSTEEVPAFLEYLETIGAPSLPRAEIRSVDVPKGGKTLLVTVGAEGSFAAMFSLLELYENSRHELAVRSVRFNKAFLSDEEQARGAAGVWEASFGLELLSYEQ